MQEGLGQPSLVQLPILPRPPVLTLPCTLGQARKAWALEAQFGHQQSDPDRLFRLSEPQFHHLKIEQITCPTCFSLSSKVA